MKTNMSALLGLGTQTLLEVDDPLYGANLDLGNEKRTAGTLRDKPGLMQQSRDRNKSGIDLKRGVSAPKSGRASYIDTIKNISRELAG